VLGIVVAPFVLTGLLATIGVVIGTVVIVVFFMWADPAFAKIVLFVLFVLGAAMLIRRWREG
jgi:hypothetical protein